MGNGGGRQITDPGKNMGFFQLLLAEASFACGQLVGAFLHHNFLFDFLKLKMRISFTFSYINYIENAIVCFIYKTRESQNRHIWGGGRGDWGGGVV